jgi:hypothetical protein
MHSFGPGLGEGPRGLHILTARRLNILAARSLLDVARAGERPRRLNILAPGDAALLREQVLRRRHFLGAGRLRLGNRREHEDEGHAHNRCECSLHHVGLPSIVGGELLWTGS